MSALPAPSRRVLSELRADRFVTADGIGRAATPVARAWFILDAALDAHASALAELDRLEAAVVAAHGYPRVPLPGIALDYAADAATIDRRVSNRVTACWLKAALRRRQLTFADAASVAGLTSAQQREARTAQDLTDATTALLLAPVETYADLALKLIVLIATGEAGPDEASTFPWLYMRLLLADMKLKRV